MANTQNNARNEAFSADALRQRRIQDNKLILVEMDIATYFPAAQVLKIFDQIVYNRNQKTRAITRDFFYGLRKDIRAADYHWFLRQAQQSPQEFAELISIFSSMEKTMSGTVEYRMLPESVWNQKSFSAKRTYAAITEARHNTDAEAFKKEVLDLMRRLPDLLE